MRLTVWFRMGSNGPRDWIKLHSIGISHHPSFTFYVQSVAVSERMFHTKCVSLPRNICLIFIAFFLFFGGTKH
jgi:hypothetical protein